jgi:putative DNA primase/helicase
MNLLGSRLAFLDESEMGGKLNESTVKTITGGAAITARNLHENFVTFEPTFQLLLLTNYKPEINVSDSIKRRIILIPFEAEFRDLANYDKMNPKHRIGNKNIEKELLEKLDELLVWLVNGSVKYFKEGLGDTPETIIKATSDYMNENDDLGNFIGNNCIKDPNGFVNNQILYNHFKNEFNTNLTIKGFINLMKNHGFNIIRRNDGRGYIGLVIK